jgi:hypothetical protein
MTSLRPIWQERDELEVILLLRSREDTSLIAFMMYIVMFS